MNALVWNHCGFVRGPCDAGRVGTFQTSPQPAIPSLPGGGPRPDAFVIKFDGTLSQVLASTLLGGEGGDYGRAIAIDSAGNIVVGGVTTSKAFPTRAPLQASFSDYSGFLASLDPGLSTLLDSTYLGDSRYFDLRGVSPDAGGNVLVFGSTSLPAVRFACRRRAAWMRARRLS
ncbi:MAG: SBBP repeat-containing protein [Acidobacteriota bacterium]|nr:SBBP repeat-containing protein [Acidobacteriota bacterium]